MSQWRSPVERLSVLRVLYLPLIAYGALAAMSFVNGHAVRVERHGVQDSLATSLLAVGVGVAYLMSVLRFQEEFKAAGRLATRFWLGAALLFTWLAFDALFQTHTSIAQGLNVPRWPVFAGYGAVMLLFLARYRATLRPRFWRLILAFAVLSSLAVITDAVTSESAGLAIAGQHFGYERTLEDVALLLLIAAFFSEALRDLTAHRGGHARSRRPASAP